MRLITTVAESLCARAALVFPIERDLIDERRDEYVPFERAFLYRL